jgi:hypothetical protein
LDFQAINTFSFSGGEKRLAVLCFGRRARNAGFRISGIKIKKTHKGVMADDDRKTRLLEKLQQTTEELERRKSEREGKSQVKVLLCCSLSFPPSLEKLRELNAEKASLEAKKEGILSRKKKLTYVSLFFLVVFFSFFSSRLLYRDEYNEDRAVIEDKLKQNEEERIEIENSKSATGFFFLFSVLFLPDFIFRTRWNA